MKQLVNRFFPGSCFDCQIFQHIVSIVNMDAITPKKGHGNEKSSAFITVGTVQAAVIGNI